MTRFEILHIIRAGGATLNKDGESVHYTRGYQVSRKDCYTLDVKHVARILRAVNRLLADIAPGEFIGVWVDDGHGAKIATFYDYGGAGYLYKWYARLFTAPRYVVKVYEIGAKTPCAIA